MKRSSRKLTPEQTRQYKALAEKIDREEKEEIKARGREVFRRHERLLNILAVLSDSREQQGLSLSELAERLDMDRSNLWRIFNDAYANPTLDTLLRIADALDVDIDLTVRPRRAG